jgi:hypothetical protein
LAERERDIRTLPAEADFVEQSLAERTRREQAEIIRNKRLRRLVTGLTLALVVALAAATGAGWYYWQAQKNAATAKTAQLEAERQSRLSRAQELAAQAQLEPNPDLKLMLAREAVFATWLTDTEVITHPFVTAAAYNALRQAKVEAQTGWHWRRSMPWRQGHTGWVGAVAYSPDGRHLVSGGRDQTVRLWDRETGQVVRELAGHTGWVGAVAYSPDGRYIVSGGEDGIVHIWDSIEALLEETDRLIQRDPPLFYPEELQRFGFIGRGRVH